MAHPEMFGQSNAFISLPLNLFEDFSHFNIKNVVLSRGTARVPRHKSNSIFIPRQRWTRQKPPSIYRLPSGFLNFLQKSNAWRTLCINYCRPLFVCPSLEQSVFLTGNHYVVSTPASRHIRRGFTPAIDKHQLCLPIVKSCVILTAGGPLLAR